MTSFASLGLIEPLQRAVREQGYETATPIQAQGIPVILAGRDVLAAAQTGTGKTAGFTLPLLQRLAEGPRATNRCVRALVLTPTRELAAQVGESVEIYGQHLSLRSTVIFGGVSINPQMMKLRGGVDILVATPGRLLDLHSQRAVDLSQVEILVLDEADRMLDMGFIHDIRRILKLLPQKRQNLLFSATFSDEIRALTKGLLDNPASIEVAPRNTTAQLVKQTVYLVDKSDKVDILSYLVRNSGWEQVLVFTRTKHGANKLSELLERDGITSAAIHGNKSQGARTRALADFKAGEVRVLVATDIAARGLDIDQLPHVVNFELPNVPEDYVHRIGRTGRAGASGEAISLVGPDERAYLRDIEKLLKRKLPAEPVPYFEAGANRSTVALEDMPRRSQPPRQPRPGNAPRSNSSPRGANSARAGAATGGAAQRNGGSAQRSGGARSNTANPGSGGGRGTGGNGARVVDGNRADSSNANNPPVVRTPRRSADGSAPIQRRGSDSSRRA
ncbi:MAG: DEAD/DEAH box helicase [Spongiibacteraceae bacterium]